MCYLIACAFTLQITRYTTSFRQQQHGNYSTLKYPRSREQHTCITNDIKLNLFGIKPDVINMIFPASCHNRTGENATDPQQPNLQSGPPLPTELSAAIKSVWPPHSSLVNWLHTSKSSPDKIFTCQFQDPGQVTKCTVTGREKMQQTRPRFFTFTLLLFSSIWWILGILLKLINVMKTHFFPYWYFISPYL